MNPAWSLGHHWSARLRWWALGPKGDGWIQGSCDAVKYSVWQKTVGFGGPEGRPVWTKLCPFKKEERLTLEQHRFELCWLTYLCVFFSIQLALWIHGSHIQGSSNLWLKGLCLVEPLDPERMDMDGQLWDFSIRGILLNARAPGANLPREPRTTARKP